MGNRSVLEFLLKLINLLLTISVVSMLILGVYCLIKWVQNSHKNHLDSEGESNRFSLVVDHLKYDSDKLPSAWFILLFLAIGTMLFLTSCLGCLGTAARNPCCLSFYSVLLFGLLMAELVVAAFLMFNQNLSEDMLQVGKRGNSDSVYHFILVNWKIVRWVVLTALVLEVIALVLALYLRSLSRAVYDSSDDEIIVSPGSQQATTDKRRNPAAGNSVPNDNRQENLVII